MDINNINNIGLSSSTSLQLNKADSAKQIKNSPNEEGLYLNINEYNKKRDELSLNVQSLNDGIATSQIAVKSIEKQQDYLKNIQNKLENINNLDNQNDLKQSITDDLKKFTQVAYETKYKNENLLVSNMYDEKATIDVTTNKNNFSIDKVNTSDYANKIFETLNGTNLTNPEDLAKLKDTVNKYADKLNEDLNSFANLSDKLKENAKETIKDQIDLYNQNTTKIKDFGKESNDFSKNNVNANIGYLAASQANIVQAQSVRLLS